VSAPNPFHYGTPVEGAQFTGRAHEVAGLVSRIRNHVNVVLVSPRRYGKSSVLLRAESELAEDNPAILRVNVLRCRDLTALVGALTANAYRIPGARWHRARQAVPEFLKRFRTNPTVTFDVSGTPSFGFDPRLSASNAEDVIADLYRLLSQEAARRPAALILDEFQAITDHGAHLPNLLKALADEYPQVSLVVAGSKRHLMEQLVTTDSAPLYGMAQKIALGPIPDDEMQAYLRRRATTGGKPMDEDTAALMIGNAGPVPNDIQHLAYEAFEISTTRIDREAAMHGLEQAVAHEAATYGEEFSRRSPGQRRVLIELAVRATDAPTSAAFVEAVGLANASSARKAVRVLEADEIVVERNGRWKVADPFFAAWLADTID
jgi:hypothetical protein